MTEDLRSQSVTLADADLVCKLANSDRSEYLKGPDLRRARRLLGSGLLEQRRLGDRYFGVTSAGKTFAKNVQEHRNAAGT